MEFFNNLRKSKSKKSLNESSSLYLSHPYVEAKLVAGSLKKIVQLPKYVNANEWIAIHVFDFFNNISMYYSTISEFCTTKECPVMQGNVGLEYAWTDPNTKKSSKVPAQQYVDYAFTLIQTYLDDEKIFPTRSDSQFPKDFDVTVRNIFRHLFRIMAHIYNFHFDKILHLHQEAHLNTLFAHFVSFGFEFSLMPDKKELQPLEELIQEIQNSDKQAN